jgi:5-methylcytosine-specific restriction protein A
VISLFSYQLLFMATFLLAWNPKRWPCNDIEEMSQSVQAGQLVTARWSCGNSKRLQRGDRVFFMRLGQEPKGIFASGFAIQGSYEDRHWDSDKASSGETAMFVRVRFDSLLSPAKSDVLPRQLLDTEPFKEMHWDTQMSGVQVPDSVALELEKVWQEFSNSSSFLSPEEISDNNAHYEGGVQQVTVNAYERNTKARKSCVEYYGVSCFVCGFDFSKVYGELGDGFIHVHHLRPLSEIKQQYRVDPINDLRPVCPNCHAMIHRRTPPLSIKELQEVLNNARLQSTT